MGVKIFAGFLAAVVVTVVGVYAAVSSGGSQHGPLASAGETLPVSEGSGCASAAGASCCSMSAGSTRAAPSESLAACTGSAVMAVPAGSAKMVVSCCSE